MLRLLVLLAFFGCSRFHVVIKEAEKGEMSVLFVGNSLTYSNNLPQLVENAAAEEGVKMKTDMLALPNYALVDHLADGKLQKMISTGKYDYVVVQQGPSSQEEGRQMLLDTAPVLDGLCKKSGAQLTYFMVWPSREYYHTFNGVIANYTAAAKSVNAMLCPVGKHWKEVTDTGDFSYYGFDGFHPSQKGSELVARVIWETLK